MQQLIVPEYGSNIKMASGVVRSQIFRLGNTTKLWGYDFHGNSVAVKRTNDQLMIEEDNGDLRRWFPVVIHTGSEEETDSLTLNE